MSSNSAAVEEYNISVVGAGGVGKSCITIRYIQNVFVDEYDPTIEDSYRKKVNIDGGEVLIEILDTAGQEEHCTSFRDQYIRRSDCFVCVYSITDPKSLEELISDHHPKILRCKDVDFFPVVLVGNKSDLEVDRVIPATSVKKVAKEMFAEYVTFLEVSAKTGENVNQIFVEAVRLIRKYRKETARPAPQQQQNSKCKVQ